MYHQLYRVAPPVMKTMIRSMAHVNISQARYPIHEQVLDGDTSLPLFNSGSRKSDTEASRHLAVKQAIIMMRARFQDPLTLPEIADSVQLSPFHFNRIFRSITGVPPSVYLASLRIEQAKKLLLRTKLSVTSICFDVGYNSLGTFTTRFTRFVGVTPSHLRHVSQSQGLQTLFQNWDLLRENLYLFNQRGEGNTIEGYLNIPTPFDGLVFIGAFTEPVPQGTPVSCTVLSGRGHYVLSALPEGNYYLFATALHHSDNLVDLLEANSSLRCANQHIVPIYTGCPHQPIDMALRSVCWTDAPILIALPWLLALRLEEHLSISSYEW
jgi:AraC family transcriptional regulator